MKNKIALGAFVGAAVGVVAGVLTAPKSGQETRDELVRKAGDVKDQALTHKDELLFKAEEAIDNVVDAFKKGK